jgi:hypothetical protein
MPLSEYLATSGDRRYTDRDVREHPELVSVAAGFLYAYGGDYDFLVQAQAVLRANGVMPVATARGVLNCMRADPRVAGSLPIPPSGAPLAIVDAWTRRPPKPVPVRPARVRLNATFKKRYLISTAPTAQTAHYLESPACQLWWMPHLEEYTAQLYVLCRRGIYAPNILMTDVIPAGRRICAGCYRTIRTGE